MNKLESPAKNIEQSLSEETKFRYAMIVEYFGGSFSGSQKQPNVKTVQSEIESVLKILTRVEVKTIFSGRTDKGVNAKGQVVHFDLPFQINTHKLILSLNSILPSEISITLLKEVDNSFHSQKSALKRWYRYTINNKYQRSVWLKEALHIQTKLNVDEMNKALSYLTGIHDFSSFKSANSANPAKECEVYKAECKVESDIIYFDIVANRFLYNMVRIIVGTLLEIGKGNYPAEHMLDVLNQKDRTKAGATANPEGLTLMSVEYEKKYCINNSYKEAREDENLFCKAS